MPRRIPPRAGAVPTGGRPAPDAIGLRRRLARDLAVGEPHGDVAGGGELGVAEPVALEAGTRCRPWCSHPSHSSTIGRVDDPEVDLVAADDGVELDRRQAVAASEPAHRRLEHAVDRLAVEDPVVERVAAAPARRGGRAGRGRRRPVRSAAGDASPFVTTWPTAAGTDGGSTAPRSHSMRSTLDVRMFRRSTGAEVPAIARPVHDDAAERRLAACAVGEHHVDRVVVGSRDAPEVGRRAVRGHRARAGGEDGGGDRAARGSSALPTRRATPGCSGSSDPRATARYQLAREMPRRCGGVAGHQPVVVDGERLEGAKVHARPGCRRSPEREAPVDLGGIRLGV